MGAAAVRSLLNYGENNCSGSHTVGGKLTASAHATSTNLLSFAFLMIDTH